MNDKFPAEFAKEKAAIDSAETHVGWVRVKKSELEKTYKLLQQICGVSVDHWLLSDYAAHALSEIGSLKSRIEYYEKKTGIRLCEMVIGGKCIAIPAGDSND